MSTKTYTRNTQQQLETFLIVVIIRAPTVYLKWINNTIAKQTTHIDKLFIIIHTDCSKACPAGGHLSADCEVCECSSVTLYGRIMDDTNQTVDKAEIYLESRRYTPIATTDIFGFFRADGICIMNEEVYIQAPGYISKHFIPLEINVTHWNANATLVQQGNTP